MAFDVAMNKSLLSKNLIFLLVSTFLASESRAFNDLNTCGTLFSETNSVDIAFQLSGYQSSDLIKSNRLSNPGWNVTRSVVVEEGCKIKACNDTRQDGACVTLNSGAHSDQENPFIKDIASIKCTCPKTCNCSDIHIKLSSCGRAYLEGGCNTCGALYSDLSPIQGDTFPEEFNDKVEAIRLRKGCTISVYPEEFYNGEETFIDQEITESFHGIIGSYECHCNDSLYEPKVRAPRPETYPQLVDIPISMNDVLKMLETIGFSMHPGLRAARQSYMNGRSSKNAYILLLGSANSGKTSAINMLFNDLNATIQDGESEIREFRIPVPIDEYGIANSELRIITTPGLGDSRGLMQDAKHLASLENYLSAHEELKDRIPNAVLIFHRFDDSKYRPFQMIQEGYEKFTKRIADENYSNIVFVLTHFCSTDRRTQRKPEDRIKLFKKIIQDGSLFPRPTHLVVGDNEIEDYDYLPMVNGYLRLPNNEYYPRNLFEKLDLVTEKGGDPIGQGVFRTAFRDSENFQVTTSSFPLDSTDADQVVKYHNMLTNTITEVVNATEITQILQEAWENKVDTQLRKMHPYSLANLRKALNDLNIITMEDVPRTDTDTIKLLKLTKNNEATRVLLWEGLGIKSPKFPVNTVAGYSYDVFSDMPLSVSPFKLDDLQHSDLGFMIPKAFASKLDPNTKDCFEVFNEKSEYLRHRLHSLGIDGSAIPLDKFTDILKPGFNIKSDSTKKESCYVTTAKDFRMFKFLLMEKSNLTDEFIASVEELLPFNETDGENVNMWKNFFNTYGTHVAKSVYGGGSIHVTFESEKMCEPRFYETVSHIIFKLENDLLLDLYENEDSTRTLQDYSTLFARIQSMTFIGGDQNYDSVNIMEMPIVEISKLIKNWKRSLRYNPAILSSEMKLEPISLIAKNMGDNYTQEIERATRLLLNSNFVYVATPLRNKNNGPGPDRDNTPFMPAMSNTTYSKFKWEELLKKVVVSVVTTTIRDEGQKLLNRKLSDRAVSILERVGVKVQPENNSTIVIKDAIRSFFNFF